MADKELDPPQKVKPAFQAPSLITSKVMSEPVSSAADQHHDHYQSVSQKAKLILPTALWILIVVAGLCFLSLLSSLNKSINTLDTLVEIEQANAKHRHQHHSAAAHGPQQAHQHGGGGERFQTISDHEEQEEEEEEEKRRLKSAASSSSWLSLPSWTSLEPTAHHRHREGAKKPHPDEPADLFDDKVVKEMIDELLKDSPANKPGSRAEVIIQASSSPVTVQKGDREAKNELASIMDTFDSVIKQFMGPIGGDGDADEKLSTTTKSDLESADGQKATVMANIDTININLSDRADGLTSHKSAEKLKLKKKNRKQEDDNLESTIEKMLDEINANQRNHEGRPLELPETILIPLGNPRPRPLKPIHRQNHQHHSHAPVAIIDDATPLSPLSNLLLPPGLLRPISHASFNPFDSPAPSSVPNQQNPGSEFIIQLGGPSDEIKPPTTKLAMSPYEMMTTSPGDQLIGSQGPAESGSSLADSLLRQTLFPVQENASSKKETMGPFTISDLDLITPESLLMGQSQRNGELSANNNKTGKNPIHDLFSLFFGPPPNSSLVVAPQMVEPKIIVDNNNLELTSGDEAAAAAVTSQQQQQQSESTKKAPETNSSESLAIKEAANDVKLSTTPMPVEVSVASTLESAPPPAATTIKQQENSPSADPLIEDFLGTMFALPQMAGQSGPIRADSQQQFGASNSNSNNNNNGAFNSKGK